MSEARFRSAGLTLDNRRIVAAGVDRSGFALGEKSAICEFSRSKGNSYRGILAPYESGSVGECVSEYVVGISIEPRSISRLIGRGTRVGKEQRITYFW